MTEVDMEKPENLCFLRLEWVLCCVFVDFLSCQFISLRFIHLFSQQRSSNSYIIRLDHEPPPIGPPACQVSLLILPEAASKPLVQMRSLHGQGL